MFIWQASMISPMIRSIVYTPQDAYGAVKDDAVYYRSTNGGITFGGGEPLMNN